MARGGGGGGGGGGGTGTGGSFIRDQKHASRLTKFSLYYLKCKYPPPPPFPPSSPASSSDGEAAFDDGVRAEESRRRLESKGDAMVAALDFLARVLVGHASVGDLERVRQRELPRVWGFGV